jgi:hypothetical protein
MPENRMSICWLTPLCISLAACVPYEPLDPDIPLRAALKDDLYTKRFKTRVEKLDFAQGFSPEFDQPFGHPIDTECAMDKEVSEVNGEISVKYYFTRTKLEDLFKIGGKFELDLPLWGGAKGSLGLEGSYQQRADEEQESLYLLATAYSTFDVTIKPEAEKKFTLSKAAKNILDKIKKASDVARVALEWLDLYGPGYIRGKEHGARMFVLFRLTNSDMVSSKKLGAALKGELSIGKIVEGKIKLEGNLQADVDKFAKSSQVSVFVRAEGFPVGGVVEVGGASKGLFTAFLEPALRKPTKPEDPGDNAMQSVAAAIDSIFKDMTQSVDADRCYAIKEYHKEGGATAEEAFQKCADAFQEKHKIQLPGRQGIYASVRAYILRPYNLAYDGLFDCPGFENSFKLKLDELASGAYRYHSQYGRLVHASDIVGLQISRALKNPAFYYFRDSDENNTPIDFRGYQARFKGSMPLTRRSDDKDVDSQPACAGAGGSYSCPQRNYLKLLSASEDGAPRAEMRILNTAFDRTGSDFWGRFLAGIKLDSGMPYDPRKHTAYSYEKSEPAVKKAETEDVYLNLLAVLKTYKTWDWCPQVIVELASAPEETYAAAMAKATMLPGTGLPTFGDLPQSGSLVRGLTDNLWVGKLGSKCPDKTFPMVVRDVKNIPKTTNLATLVTYGDSTSTAANKVVCKGAEDKASYFLTRADGAIYGETDVLRDNLLAF